jgi:hypothetical protein
LDVLLRIATLTLAQALDMTTFVLMVRRDGPGAEANPIVASMLVELGMPAVTAAKIALIVLVGALALAATGRPRGVWSVVGGLPLALAIAFGLIGGITNAAAILG